MQAYYGGQIPRECRGDLAVVISRDGIIQTPDKPYEAFLEAIVSPEFLNLTGVRVPSKPLERVYMGVSRHTGESLLRAIETQPASATDLRSIDRLAVLPYFIEKTSAAPV